MLRQAQQEGNSNSETSVAFLEQLRGRHSGRLNVIWDNAPAHCQWRRHHGAGRRVLPAVTVSGVPSGMTLCPVFSGRLQLDGDDRLAEMEGGPSGPPISP